MTIMDDKKGTAPIRKVYISGPISGMEDGNRMAFQLEYNWLQANGFQPVNPHRIKPHVHVGKCPEGYNYDGKHSSACYLRADFKQLLDCDAVLMLNGWELSQGAQMEAVLAGQAGIPVFVVRQSLLVFVADMPLRSVGRMIAE